MRRWIYATEPVQAVPATAEAVLRAQLPELLAHAADSPPSERAPDSSFTLTLSASVLGLSASAPVRVTAGVARRDGPRMVLPLRWKPLNTGALLPSFDGTLELEAQANDRARVSLVGAYRVPLGSLGRLADATVLGSAADDTIGRLVRALAAAIEEHAAQDPRLVPEPATAAPASPETPPPLRVREVMTPDPIVFDPALPVRSAALVLSSRRVSGAPVVDADGALIGVLSEGDLVQKAAAGAGHHDPERQRRRTARTVGEACSRPAQVTVPEATVGEAALLMVDADIARLVVVDAATVVGIVSRHDVLRALLRADAAIQEAASARLAELGQTDLTVHAAWGLVHLAGTLAPGITPDEIEEALIDLDGVMAVDFAGVQRTDAAQTTAT